MESEIKTKSTNTTKSQSQNQISRTLKYESSEKTHLPESEHGSASTSHKGRLHSSICSLECLDIVLFPLFLFASVSKMS